MRRENAHKLLSWFRDRSGPDRGLPAGGVWSVVCETIRLYSTHGAKQLHGVVLGADK